MIFVNNSTFVAFSLNFYTIGIYLVVWGVVIFGAGLYGWKKYGGPFISKPDFFRFKLFQGIFTYVLFLLLYSPARLCGQLTAPQYFVNSTIAAGQHCTDLTMFGLNMTDERNVLSDLEKWFKLSNSEQPISIDEMIFMDEMAPKFPTRRQCFCIMPSFVSALKNAFGGVPTNHLEQFADMLALLLFGYLCAVVGFIIWCYSTWISAFLLHNWTTHWECTNFRPDNLWVLLFILILSSVLVCMSFIEIFFIRLLLRKAIIHLRSATTIKRTGNVMNGVVKAKKNGITMDKKNDKSMIRLVPLPIRMSNDFKY
uniref:Uncharacterized protein n=1 Tax=Globodera pallida TaxID=36090 RepID=A0A183BQU0_GLOPA